MSDKCNCYRFSPRDSLSGAVAQIADYLSKHPGWNETELRAFVDGLISPTGVESFNGRTGTVTLDKNDVNDLKIASAYFAKVGESIDRLDLVSLYNQGVRFVFTDFNSETNSYNLSFVLDYSSDSGTAVYYPISADSITGGNVISVNGKTGKVELKVVDVSNGNSSDKNAYIFIDESEDYPDIVAPDSNKLGGQNPQYYATAENVSGITPDNTVVDGKPWTSKKIVDTLCMPIEVTGNPVQVYPVENYPLGVKVSWEPTQEGSGDPSPQNIRPITGRDAVSVTRCGKNLVEHRYAPGYTVTKSGVTFTVNDDYSITVKGKATEETYFNFKAIKSEDLIATNNIVAMGKTVAHNGFEIRDIVVQPVPAQHETRLYLLIVKGTVVDTTYYPMIVYGSTATPYEPYTGSTTNIALPETVYGGTLVVETGVVTVSNRIIIADGTVNKFTPDGTGEFWNMPEGSAQGIYKNGTIKSSHLTRERFDANEVKYFIYTTPIKMEGLFNTADDLNAYLVEQNAAGTPVTFVYKLSNSYTIQLTPQQIVALSGVNTLYTDAGTLTVTGREDPRHTIIELKNAIISLGGNI